MLITTLAVIFFGIIAVVFLFIFGMCKLQGLWNNVYLLGNKDSIEPCQNKTLCKTLKEMNENYMERRNEFWQNFGLFSIIIVIITLLVVLLLKEKISSEAAMPIIAGLGSFAAGKVVTSVKNNTTAPDNPPIGTTEDKPQG